LALKSFGIVATISKLGIPILVSTKSRPRDIRVDFFYNIFTQVGDDQDVLQGVSTLTARLSEYARILERTQSSINSSEDDYASFTNHSLILLDELGTGTDQNTGGALAQAILENLLEQKWVRTVVTTHSPRIKSMSLLDKRMDCATVCLDDNELDDSSISKIDTVTSLRSFKLQYGIVGESNGLRAGEMDGDELFSCSGFSF
jgi:DNA mismatch repair protein MutS2